MTDDDAKWLAGVFDSRGSVYFQEHVARTGRDAGRIRRGLLVNIQCGRHPGLLDEIKRVVGGGSSYAHRIREGAFRKAQREAPSFSCSARRARGVLVAIRDYVRVRRQAVLAALSLDARFVDPDYATGSRRSRRGA